ncbi:MAG: hypothetical protein HDS89_00930 [Bacteroidales bacterium]|nr:hypothetical protein [Bacteroidales bacterium]
MSDQSSFLFLGGEDGFFFTAASDFEAEALPVRFFGCTHCVRATIFDAEWMMLFYGCNGLRSDGMLWQRIIKSGDELPKATMKNIKAAKGNKEGRGITTKKRDSDESLFFVVD